VVKDCLEVVIECLEVVIVRLEGVIEMSVITIHPQHPVTTEER